MSIFRNYMMAIGAGLLLLEAGCSALIGYKTEQEVGTACVCGGTKLPMGFVAGGFAEIDGSSDDPSDADSLYGELSVSKPIHGNWSLTADVRDGTGCKTTTKFGPTWRKQGEDGSSLSVSLYPLADGGDDKAEVKIHGEACLPHGWRVGAITKIKDHGGYYAKPYVSWTSSEGVGIYVDADVFGNLDGEEKPTVLPSVRAKFDF